MESGQAHFHAAGEHSIENIGTSEGEVPGRRQNCASARGRSGARRLAVGASSATQLLLDNDDVRVSEVRLAAGDTLPRHPGLARVVYALGDYTISYTANSAEPVVNTFTAGQAHWHDADEHLIVNTGATEARFLIVQFKR